MIRAYKGRDELASVAVPAKEVGIHKRLSVRAYRSPKFYLAENIIAQLNEALLGLKKNDPVWLQIDRSSGLLAIVPWEQLLAPVFKRPLLRIPNFLVDPLFLEGPLSLVICASAPSAKQFYSVNDFTSDLIERLQHTIVQGSNIHVFADAVAYHGLRSRFQNQLRSSHRVKVYSPEAAATYGTGDARISKSNKLSSPWLQWMEAELYGCSIDAVHFICPGYFQDSNGSIALARSPIENEDTSWSHFVGTAQLREFLDKIGAWALALGAPYENVWALGLRLLANEMAWTRPGPVLLYETQSRIDAAEQAYCFLFSEDYRPPPQAGEILLYCHPKRLSRYDDQEEHVFESSTLHTEDPDHEWLHAAVRQLARKPQRSEKKRIEGGPEPDWARSNQLLIEQSFFDISDQHGALARGTADGLRFLSRLQDKYLKEK